MVTLFRASADSQDAVTLDAMAAAASPELHIVNLTVSKDSTTGKYHYDFSTNSLVFLNVEDSVIFNLIDNIPDASAAIVKHVATDTERPTPGNQNSKLRIIDPSGGNDVDPKEAYKPNTDKVRYKVRLKEYEMIYVGLIVAITPNGGGKTTYLLCDPQIGNGPP